MEAVKSLVIIEFKKITDGYRFLSGIGENSFDFFEIMPHAPGKLVCFIGGSESTTEDVWIAAKKVKKNILDSHFLKKNISPILKSLYGQQRPSAQDFFGVIQSKTVSTAIKTADDLLKNSKSYLLEIDSGRALNGTCLVYFTGNNSEQKLIEKIVKKHRSEIAILPKKDSSVISRYFQLG